MDVSLKNNDWLTQNSKNIAIDKLLTFKYKIGHPKIWKDTKHIRF